jgi:hypothetical protein
VLDPRKGCDFRFEKAYALLAREAIPFHECFHTGDLLKSIAGRWRSRKLAWTLEAAEGLFPTGEDPGLPEPETPGAPWILDRWWKVRFRRYLAMAMDRRRCAERLTRRLRAAQVRILISMDEFRSNVPLLVACRRAGVRTLLVQHGLLTGYHLGWVVPGMPTDALPPVDDFLVHSPFWADVLRAHNPELARRARVVRGWSGVMSLEKRGRPEGPDRGGRIVALVLYETLWPDLGEVRQAMARLLTEPGVEIWFKVRPDSPAEAQVEPYFRGTGGRPARIVKDLDQEMMDAVDVAVGSHSSLMYQLAAARLPVVKLETSYAFGDQLVAFGIAEPWKPAGPFRAAAEAAMGRDAGALARIRARFLPAPGDPDYADLVRARLREAGALGPEGP